MSGVSQRPLVRSMHAPTSRREQTSTVYMGNQADGCPVPGVAREQHPQGLIAPIRPEGRDVGARTRGELAHGAVRCTGRHPGPPPPPGSPVSPVVRNLSCHGEGNFPVPARPVPTSRVTVAVTSRVTSWAKPFTASHLPPPRAHAGSHPRPRAPVPVPGTAAGARGSSPSGRGLPPWADAQGCPPRSWPSRRLPADQRGSVPKRSLRVVHVGGPPGVHPPHGTVSDVQP